MQYSLRCYMSQVCIQNTIDVFKYHLFIQKNNLFVFAFYFVANHSDCFVRGWSSPNSHEHFAANGGFCEHLLLLTLLSHCFKDYTYVLLGHSHQILNYVQVVVSVE
jgi:hypothetical protein